MKINRKDIVIFILLVAIIILLRIPTMDVLIGQDTNKYAQLSESIITQGKYLYNNQPHNKYPIGYPLFSAPFMLLSENQLINLRIGLIFWVSITAIFVYLISREFNIPRKWAFASSLLVILNPWYHYYTSLIPVSEGLAIMLCTFAIYFWLLKEKSFKAEKDSYLYSILTGLGFGLMIITRYTYAFFILPFLIYELVQFIRQKEMLQRILTGVLASLPLFIWLIRNYLVFSGVFPKGYSVHLSLWMYAPMMAVIYLIFSPIAVFMTLLPQVIIQSYRKVKGKNLFWILNLAGLISLIASNIFLTYNPYPDVIAMAFSRLRYMLVLIPTFSILGVLSVGQWKKKWKKYAKTGVIVTILIFFFSLCFWNYGPVKDTVDSVFPTPSLFSQRASTRMQAVDWINDNLPQETRLVGGFKQNKIDCSADELNVHLDRFLREDIEYKCVSYSDNQRGICSEDSYILMENDDPCPQKEILKSLKKSGQEIYILK